MSVLEADAPIAPPEAPAGEPLLTIREAAALLRISPSTAKRRANEGRLPGALPKLGGHWRISKVELLKYLARAVPGDL